MKKRFTVKTHSITAPDLDESEAWRIFLKVCSHVTSETRVELLKDAKVIAHLVPSTQQPKVVPSVHDAQAASLA